MTHNAAGGLNYGVNPSSGIVVQVLSVLAQHQLAYCNRCALCGEFSVYFFE